MIKKILLAIIVALPATVFAQKFGTVNADAILQAMPEVTAMQTTISEASKKYEDEFSKLQEEMQKKITEYQTLEKDTTTPDALKERRMQDIQELDNKIQQFRNTASMDLQRQQQQLMAPIQQKVMTAIQTVGQEGNFTFIFENVVPVYVGTDVTDVTPLVKAKLGIK